MVSIFTNKQLQPFCDFIVWPRYQFITESLLCLVLGLTHLFLLTQFFFFFSHTKIAIFLGTKVLFCLSSLLEWNLYFPYLVHGSTGCPLARAFSTLPNAKALMLCTVFLQWPLKLVCYFINKATVTQMCFKDKT